MREHGFIVASARVLKRAWQIYIAHVFLFAIYLAEIAYVAHSFDNPLYTEEMGVLDFLKNPDVTILQALLLKFKPVNMDVLPLYIVLLAWFPPMLWLLLRAPSIALVASAAFYALTWWFDWNIPAYPHGRLAVQSLRLAIAVRVRRLVRARRRATAVALDQFAGRHRAGGRFISLFAFCIAMTWYFPRLAVFVPKFVSDAIYPIDKTNLDVLRIVHFLSLAVITVWFVPRDWPALQIAVLLAGDRVRAAFAGNLLPRRVPGLRRPLRLHRSVQPAADARHRQRRRHRHHGWRGGPGFVV